MQALALAPTEVAQWQNLLQDAQRVTTTTLIEPIESYLVFLLIRFTQETQLADSAVGLDFLETYHAPNPKAHQSALQTVGDKCLLFSGLFPEQALHRHVTIHYFVQLGKSAYGTLACFPQAKQQAPFALLCQEFVSMIDVLQATRDIRFPIEFGNKC